MSTDSQTTDRIVIVGASLAGGTAALTLRERGYAGEILLIGAEEHLPYERPPLSKALLLGEADEPDWVATAEDWEAKEITLLLGTRVTGLDLAARTVTAGGTSYAYTTLLLATGSTARRLDTPGFSLPGVLTLRTLDDARLLRSLLTEGRKVVVVGAGWIGCEVAAAARSHGAVVTMIEMGPQPLAAVLGETVGASFGALHREHGVDLRLGVGVTEFVGETGLTGVRLADGTVVEADIAVVGAGAVPALELAADAGLELDGGGVAVDAVLRTSDPQVFAVGDIAAQAHPHYDGRLRVEHWDTAKNQGAHVAANLLGDSDPYTVRPFFFSDQYDVGCEYRGHADPQTDELVVSGDLDAREYTAVWLRDGVVTAALNVNQWDDGDALQALVDGAKTVSRDDLAAGTF
jgi:NADPH-dependent 2,4-dienoyl-CoA reductase/sulfur reductase-like enzyme